MASEQSAPNLVGQTIASRYRLTRVLGSGGMGEVYVAQDAGGHSFAVKVIHRELADEEVLARFVREGMLTKSIQSPHVVPVVDVGHDLTLDLPYIVMSLLRGWDLSRLLEHTGAMEPRAAVRIAIQACAGLSAAHGVGVVHRDIKPANIFVEYEDEEAVFVRLVDFGIGKKVDANMTQLTETGRAMGSPLYMSPEQIRSTKHVDHRTDIFSLGVVLYEMLAGQAPWGDLSSVGDLMVAVCTKEAPPIQDFAPWLAPRLCLVVDQTLQKAPRSRFQSAAELSTALHAFAGDGDQLARHMLISVPDDLRTTTAPRAHRKGMSEAPTELRIDQATADSDPMVGKTLGEHYRVVRPLGSGGMGKVYEVVGPNGVRAAAKIISAEVTGQDAQKIKRFLREARAARSIEGRHVAKTFELGTDRELGAPYIIMELLTGVDLASVIRDRAPLQPSIAARIGVQAAHGLGEAHARNIVHRDVKPANLFLHSTGAAGDVTVKVCDFGIAKLVNEHHGDQTSQDLTHTGGMLGSPMYMSPEQAKSAKTVDHRSDLWSLCVTLYEAISGKRPWHEYSTLGEIIVAICTEPIPPLAGVAPWVDPGLARVIERGLERDAAQRWQSAEELARALEPYAGASAALRTGDIRTVDGETRARIASPASLSLGEQATVAATVSKTLDQPKPTEPGRRRGPLLVAAAAVALACVAGVAVVGRTVVVSRANASAVPSLTPPGEGQRSYVAIEPPDSKVTVDGRDSEVVSGRVALFGGPGDGFDLVVRSNAGEARTHVVLSKDGTASPDRIVVIPAAAPAVSSSAAVGTPDAKQKSPAQPGGARGGEKKPAEVKAGAPAPSAAKPPAPPAGTLQAAPTKEDW